MSNLQPAHLANVARRLQAHAALGRQASESATAVHRTLFARLAPFLGVAGTRALFVRAIKLAARDFAALRSVELGTPREDPLLGLETCLRAEPSAHAVATSVALCRTLLELLSTLIGERLVFQVLKSAWPAFDLYDTGVEAITEEAK
jgi:hypothetical protein